MKVLKAGKTVSTTITKTKQGYDVVVRLGSQQFKYGATAQGLMHLADYIMASVDDADLAPAAVQAEGQ